MKHLVLIAACLLALAGCKNNGTAPVDTPSGVDYSQVAVPDFSADSAFAFVERQLAFGNRIPGSNGWSRCAEWLATQMRRWCDTVIVQEFKAELWNGSTVPTGEAPEMRLASSKEGSIFSMARLIVMKA